MLCFSSLPKERGKNVDIVVCAAAALAKIKEEPPRKKPRGFPYSLRESTKPQRTEGANREGGVEGASPPSLPPLI